MRTTPILITGPRGRDWSPQVGVIGDIVEGVTDIDQAILVILSTPLRSDPHRPTFGWGGYRWLDRPVNRALPHLVRDTYLALELWEPRIIVTGVLVTMIEGHHWQLTIKWRLRANDQPGTTQVQL